MHKYFNFNLLSRRTRDVFSFNFWTNITPKKKILPIAVFFRRFYQVIFWQSISLKKMNDEFHPILHDDREAQIFFLPPKKISIIPLTYLASLLFLLCFFTFFLLRLEKEIFWEYWKVFLPLYFSLGLMSLTIYEILTHQRSPYEGLGKNVFLSVYFF